MPAALLVLVVGCSATGATSVEGQENGDPITTSTGATSVQGQENGDPITTSTGPAPEAGYADTVRPTWQANGRVESIVMSDDAVYLAGEFTAIAPPGSDDWVTHPYLAALDAASGAPLPWSPEVNGRVRSLDLSDDGQTLYFAGEFSEVGGEPRTGVAAVDAVTGVLNGDFAPEIDGKVRSVLADADSVYIGGTFTKVSGQPRSLIAALDPHSGQPSPNWAPRIEYPVRPDIANVITMALSGDRETLYVGGTFRSVDDESRNGTAALDVSDGRLDPWNPRLLSRAEDLETQVYDIALDDEHVYLCGDYHLTDGVFTPNLVAVDTGGQRRADWEVTTDGGVNSCDIIGGRIYLGGHFDRVGGPNADPKINPSPTGEIRNHLASVDLETGDVSEWDPAANSVPGVYAVAAGERRIAVGGDFDQVGADGAHQQGFAVFEISGT